MAASRVDRRVIALAVGIPVVMLAAFVLVAALDGGDGPDEAQDLTTTIATDPPASTAPVAVDEAWNDMLESALEPLGDAIPRLADAVTSWSQADLDDDELATVLDAVEPAFAEVRRATVELPAHPGDELATPLIQEMARLYERAVDAHRAAVAADDGPVATQYDRLGRRLRILGDRVFDRARERTAVAFDPGEGVDVRPPSEVPDWTRLGLAAGPPLEPADTNVDELPRQREEERASQPTSAWESAVADLGAPTVDVVGAALDAADAEELGRFARSLLAAAETLRSMPVPDGDRGRADRLALAWLVRADAARAGQLGALSDRAGSGGALATALLGVSDASAFTSG